MPTFTPPIGVGIAWGDPDSPEMAERLMSFYGSIPQGETIYQDHTGTWQRLQYPYQGGASHRTFDDGVLISSTTDNGLADALQVFLGGSIYDIDFATSLILIAAGFGEFVNTATVDHTWFKREAISKFTEWNLSENSSSVYAVGVNGAENLTITESSGNNPIQDNSRRFFVHSDTSLNADFDATVVLDPSNYAIDGIAEQSGIVLRAQQSGGKNTGITINNNVFFVVPHVNIGVWRSNTDGTEFEVRGTSLAIGLILSFPMRYDIALASNIIRVRAYAEGLAAPSWSDPTYATTVNLDTDAGDPGPLPTPTGEGSAGLIAAHLGTDPRVSCRYRGLKIAPRGKLFPEI